MAVKKKNHSIVRPATEIKSGSERTRFPLLYWMNNGALNRAQLPNGDLVSVLMHLNIARELQKKIVPESYSFDSFAAMIARGQLDDSQVLLKDCFSCHGKGYIGDEDTEIELCPICSGYGVNLTPLAVELLNFLQWWEKPEKKITEKEIEKKNARLALLTEAKRKKFAVQARLGMHLEGLRQQKAIEAGIELSKKISAETEKIDAELEEKLKALEEE